MKSLGVIDRDLDVCSASVLEPLDTGEELTVVDADITDVVACPFEVCKRLGVLGQ